MAEDEEPLIGRNALKGFGQGLRLYDLDLDPMNVNSVRSSGALRSGFRHKDLSYVRFGRAGIADGVEILCRAMEASQPASNGNTTDESDPVPSVTGDDRQSRNKPADMARRIRQKLDARLTRHG